MALPSLLAVVLAALTVGVTCTSMHVAGEGHALVPVPVPVRLSVCPPHLSASLPTLETSASYATVHAAQAATRELLAAGHSGDIVVELCAGTHPLRDVLVFGPLDVAAGNHTVECVTC